MISRTLDELIKPFRFFLDWPFEEHTFEQPYSQVYYDNESNYWTVEVELPGLTKDDVTIKVIDGSIYITAKNENLGREFSAQYYLGRDIDQNSIEANMEHGLLTVRAKILTPEEHIIKIN